MNDRKQTFECNVCSCEFDLIGECGIVGDFGIIPVAFCPTCLTCMVDMVHQMYECPFCESNDLEWKQQNPKQN